MWSSIRMTSARAKSGFSPPTALVSTSTSAPSARTKRIGNVTSARLHPSYPWTRPSNTATLAPFRSPSSSRPAWPGAFDSGTWGMSA